MRLPVMPKVTKKGMQYELSKNSSSLPAKRSLVILKLLKQVFMAAASAVLFSMSRNASFEGFSPVTKIPDGLPLLDIGKTTPRC